VSGRALGSLLCVVAACSTDHPTAAPIKVTAPAPPPQRLAGRILVSKPIAPPGQTGAAAQSVAYVSLPPKSVDWAETVTISNRRSGASVSPVMRMGGFDPITIAAIAGDTLDAAVSLPRLTANFTTVVTPPTSAPHVVRTDPTPSSIGALIETVVTIVFSEPVDPSTTTSAAVRLLNGAQNVGGSSVLDSTGLVARFTPSSPLVPNTDYHVEVAQTVMSTSGVALAGQAAWNPFTTAPPGSTTAVAALVGTWDVTNWQFVNTAPGGGVRSEELSQYVSKIRLTITRASPTSVRWRWEEIYSANASDVVTGSATVGDGWLFGLTEHSPWFNLTDPCSDGDVCPLQNLHDVQRNGDALTITRHDIMLHVDGTLGSEWPAQETVMLYRVPLP
jgi:hypothetical protein